MLRVFVYYLLICCTTISNVCFIDAAEITSSLQQLQQSLQALAPQIKPIKAYPWEALSWWEKQVKGLPFLSISIPPPSIQQTIKYEDYIGLLREVTQQNMDQVSEVITGDFEFYAERAVLKQPGIIYCWGDFHGDVHTLIASLSFLQNNEKILDNSFKITDKNTFFVFNGDYVDRGWYGVEVQSLLCLLKKNNPNNVFLMRGNHEDVSVEMRYKFFNELLIKYKGIEENFFLNKEGVWASFYKSLPAVLYVGVKQGTKLNYLQFCHGGLEFYNPIKLLSQDVSISIYFEKIQKRYSLGLLNAVYELSSSVSAKSELLTILKDIARDRVMGGFSVSSEEALAIAKEPDIKKRWSLLQPLLKRESFAPSELGYMWADFNTLGENSLWDPDRGSVRYGLSLSNILLSLTTKNIIAVFRAHQHNPKTMPGLFVEANRNIYKLPYMEKHFVFTSVATPTMALPGRGFMKIKIDSDDPKKWKLTSIWSKCKEHNPTVCNDWSSEVGDISLEAWKST